MSNNLLKLIKNEICESVTLIINQPLTTGIFPNKLKIAKVIPLFKKGDIYTFDNYRPISLLPSISKIFERTMYDQIYNYFQNNELFYNSQYGFRKNRSTELATLEIIDRIIQEMDKYNTPINIYIDLSKAFDTIDHNILLCKLKYYGLNQSRATSGPRARSGPRRPSVRPATLLGNNIAIRPAKPQPNKSRFHERNYVA